jgi:hypothetical protein
LGHHCADCLGILSKKAKSNHTSCKIETNNAAAPGDTADTGIELSPVREALLKLKTITYFEKDNVITIREEIDYEPPKPPDNNHCVTEDGMDAAISKFSSNENLDVPEEDLNAAFLNVTKMLLKRRSLDAIEEELDAALLTNFHTDQPDAATPKYSTHNTDPLFKYTHPTIGCALPNTHYYCSKVLKTVTEPGHDPNYPSKLDHNPAEPHWDPDHPHWRGDHRDCWHELWWRSCD